MCTEDQETIFKSAGTLIINDATVTAECPSNIALVKYWGKYPNQIPANPSISYTLNQCKSKTTIEFAADQEFSVKMVLGENEEPAFAKKIEDYLKKITEYLPWALSGSYSITSMNTFPHSSGIASSASGFGALARGLVQLDVAFGNSLAAADAVRKASFLARIGSGSACRSLYNGLVAWGRTAMLPASSDLYGTLVDSTLIAPVFRQINDWVLLVHEGQKQVSSTVGHGLMNGHPYAAKRFEEAQQSMRRLLAILQEGDLEKFIALVEHEALTLHAMMMMSSPAFILMKANTLKIIEKIWEYRRDTTNPVFFTLDAGANVHVLFPAGQPYTVQIKDFIEKQLLPLTEKGGIVKDFADF